MAVRRLALILAGSILLAACHAPPQQDQDSWASVDILRDCQDKPFFDTVSAGDRKTVVKGMTERQREVCMEIRSGHGLGGAMQ